MLKPHQYRVLNDKAYIDNKLGRLVRFLSSPTAVDVDPLERERMHQQADLLRKLSEVLQARIDYFKDSAPVGPVVGDVQ